MSFITETFSPVKHQIQNRSRRSIEPIMDVNWVNPPRFARSNKSLSPAQITGLRYERRVEEHLAKLANHLGLELHSHTWIGYGQFYAQPDFILKAPGGSAIVIEAKYTWTDTSDQRKLYENLLDQLGLNPITSLTICRNLTSETPKDKIIHDFYDIEQDSIWQLRI